MTSEEALLIGFDVLHDNGAAERVNQVLPVRVNQQAVGHVTWEGRGISADVSCTRVGDGGEG